MGGFDASRYPRPQIEDIELGLRVRALGGQIVLDPRIEATHLKRWTLREILATDIFHRGVPWVRLLWERRGRLTRSLNVGSSEPFKVALAGAGLAALLGSPFAGPALLLAALACWLALVVWNRDLYRWLADQRGVGFAVRAIPLHLLYYAGNVVAGLLGTVAVLWARVRPLRGRRVSQAAGLLP